MILVKGVQKYLAPLVFILYWNFSKKDVANMTDNKRIVVQYEKCMLQSDGFLGGGRKDGFVNICK